MGAQTREQSRQDALRRPARPPRAAPVGAERGRCSPVQRDHHAEGTAVRDVGVGHGGRHVLVAELEERLDGAEVVHGAVQEGGRLEALANQTPNAA